MDLKCLTFYSDKLLTLNRKHYQSPEEAGIPSGYIVTHRAIFWAVLSGVRMG